MRTSKMILVIVAAMIVLVSCCLFLTLGVSLAIAVIVSAIIILYCSYQFLAILIRGKYNTSGYSYTISWKTSPVAMCITLLSLLSGPVLIIWGWSMNMPVFNRNDGREESYRIYMDFQPGFWPEFCYEGPGVHRQIFVTQDDDGTFNISYSAMLLPSGMLWILNGTNDLPEYRIFDFTGKLSRSDGHCIMEGDLQSQGSGQLVVTGAENEVSLHPGNNQIKMEWNVCPKDSD